MTLNDIECRYRQITDFPDYYITENGDVYSARLRGHEKEPHLHKMKPKNPGKSNKYLNIILCRDNYQQTKSIHRLVAEYFVDGWFDGAVVNHIDGNNRNNHASNLEWTTTRDNIVKSYQTSGVGSVRNKRACTLFCCGKRIASFESVKALLRFVEQHCPDVSTTSLEKYGKSGKFQITKQ